ncbi:MAG: glutathione synthase [bacterium]|nr:glutathione synthase [Gammaproteobacteria bacterium]HIL99061.1 glutathione synthase [Pseudomonadales bacterium]
MSLKLGVVMDSLESINYKKDSTLAMMTAAQSRGWDIFTIQQAGLFVSDGSVLARQVEIRVKEGSSDWFEVCSELTGPVRDLDAVLMRKDPPFDMEYIYSTYLLEMAEKEGVLVLNRPGSIRDCNEKLFALQFPQCCPPHIVSRDDEILRSFHKNHQDVIFKPLDGMGGTSIFRIKHDDPNLSVIIETLTDNGNRQIMAQKFIPEISDGDTRILLINGEPIPYGLARIPAKGETRGNLAAGGEGVARPLNDRDLWICEQVGATLRQKGLYFVGIDVIGDFLTEINVTCPTCLREIDKAYELDIAGDYITFIETLIG